MSDCWVWPGRIDSDGYGRLGHRQLAHRAVYVAARGPIPANYEIDHLCMNRACFNPDHLEVTTHSENTHRAVLSRTHCKRGHLWNQENTYTRPLDGSRFCRTCNLENTRSYRQRRALREGAIA
jgi:HNH endonuclease